MPFHVFPSVFSVTEVRARIHDLPPPQKVQKGNLAAYQLGIATRPG
jgi:hypothetical protein